MRVDCVKPGQTVICGARKGRFLRMSGSDALIEMRDGSRVMWSGATEVDTLEEAEELTENCIPKLEAELARLEGFTIGKYAKLGLTVSTECIVLPKSLHPPLIRGALGEQPKDAIVCRRCSTKFCVRADHLFWGTRSDCQRDMVLRGVAKPSGKQASAITVAAKIIQLRLRLSRVRGLVDLSKSVSDI